MENSADHNSSLHARSGATWIQGDVSDNCSSAEANLVSEATSDLEGGEIELLGEDFDDVQSMLSVSTLSNDGKMLSCDEISTTFDESAIIEAQILELGSDRSTISKSAKLDKNAPRVFKNDIRRFFANMFMNTVNSADFHRTEDFFRTFMASQCSFVSQQQLSQEFRVPNALHTVGARQFAHYLLGCFVMYPDMCLSMTDAQVITSNAWAGTKIIMNVEYHLTKTHDIPVECWVPPTPSLDRVYKETSLEGMMAAVHLSAAEEAEKEQFSFPSAANSIKTSTPASTGVVKKMRKRRRRCDIEAAAKAYIPESYVGILQRNAIRMDEPRKLFVKGEFTLFLDEKNQIQHAVLKGQQLNA
eukprot:gene19968-22698_t